MASELLSLQVVTDPSAVAADLLIVAVPEGEPTFRSDWPDALAQAVRQLAGRAGFRGIEKQSVETLLSADSPVRALQLRGLGAAAELKAHSLEKWLYRALDQAGNQGLGRLALALPALEATSGAAAAERVLRQLAVATYRFDQFKAVEADEPQPLAELILIPPPGQEAAYEQALGAARVTARAVVRCRELANMPPNVATVEWLAEQALTVAREHGFEVTVYGRAELEAKGMGGILAVGRGSRSEPRLVRLAWGSEGPLVALVGKGVVFDAGGLCLKPAASMEEMKYDKGGACTVIAVAAAVAELGLPLRLRVYLPLVENMPDGAAYRPSDILRCYNGKTVEVLDTDAEGRLILADALALAVEEGAEALLELSTLTGHCAIALGRFAGGLFSPDDALSQELLTAAERTGERLWRLPLWPEFREMLKGNHADIKNHAGRWGGASTAAAFLANFVEPLERWAHLDIAGPVNRTEDGGGPVGATGYGVALALEWLRRLGRG
jgi:leucyl aminopeptidase